MNSNYGYNKSQDQPSEFYFPLMTYHGKKLSMVNDRKPNFSKARRFSQYEIESKRLGDKIGPGSYTNYYNTIGSPRNTSIPMFCKFKKSTNRWHLFSKMQERILNTKNIN